MKSRAGEETAIISWEWGKESVVLRRNVS